MDVKLNKCDTCLEIIKDTNANQHNPNALNDVGQHKNALEGDAISRQAALDALKNLEDLQGRNVFTKNGLYPWNVIAQLPSVTPKQRTGHWITKDGKEQGYDIAGVKTWYIQIVCSECGFIKTAIEGHTGQYHYCPNCGAKMVEPQESETGISEEISREEIAALLARESEEQDDRHS